jgi:hypothetical protein
MSFFNANARDTYELTIFTRLYIKITIYHYLHILIYLDHHAPILGVPFSVGNSKTSLDPSISSGLT